MMCTIPFSVSKSGETTTASPKLDVSSSLVLLLLSLLLLLLLLLTTSFVTVMYSPLSVGTRVEPKEKEEEVKR